MCEQCRKADAAQQKAKAARVQAVARSTQENAAVAKPPAPANPEARIGSVRPGAQAVQDFLQKYAKVKFKYEYKLRPGTLFETPFAKGKSDEVVLKVTIAEDLKAPVEMGMTAVAVEQKVTEEIGKHLAERWGLDAADGGLRGELAELLKAVKVEPKVNCRFDWKDTPTKIVLGGGLDFVFCESRSILPAVDSQKGKLYLKFDMLDLKFDPKGTDLGFSAATLKMGGEAEFTFKPIDIPKFGQRSVRLTFGAGVEVEPNWKNILKHAQKQLYSWAAAVGTASLLELAAGGALVGALWYCTYRSMLDVGRFRDLPRRAAVIREECIFALLQGLARQCLEEAMDAEEPDADEKPSKKLPSKPWMKLCHDGGRRMSQLVQERCGLDDEGYMEVVPREIAEQQDAVEEKLGLRREGPDTFDDHARRFAFVEFARWKQDGLWTRTQMQQAWVMLFHELPESDSTPRRYRNACEVWSEVIREMESGVRITGGDYKRFIDTADDGLVKVALEMGPSPVSSDANDLRLSLGGIKVRVLKGIMGAFARQARPTRADLGAAWDFGDGKLVQAWENTRRELPDCTLEEYREYIADRTAEEYGSVAGVTDLDKRGRTRGEYEKHLDPLADAIARHNAWFSFAVQTGNSRDRRWAWLSVRGRFPEGDAPHLDVYARTDELLKYKKWQ